MRAGVAAVLVLTACCAAFGQPVSPRRAFEVASVKPHVGPYSRIDVSTAGLRLTVDATTVWGLIMYAYDVKNFQVVESPGALSVVGNTPYDIVAKAEGEVIPNKAEFREMMQSLLTERFKLELAREMRDTPVYALIVGKNGPRFKESSPGASPMGQMSISGRNNVVDLPQTTMDDFTAQLANAFLDRPVVDRTGLNGTYAIHLTYTPENKFGRGEPDPNETSIFTAVQEQLGLRLVPQRVEIEYLMVKHVEKPGAN